MALTNLFTHIFNKLSLFPRLFQPTTDALFSNLPINYRWRLLLLQPINILCFLLTAPSFLFSTSYTVIYIPTRSGPKRCLVFQPARRKPDASRPLHIDFHGGGFIGGFPEQGARWCKLLAEKTGAVVVSGSYRLAPRHIYPSANEDVDDIITYLLAHAKDFGANKEIVTLGGSSVGGTLTLSASQLLPQGAAKAWLGFCAPVDLRLRPSDKKKPPGFPTHDPLAFLEPLWDAYAGTQREANRAVQRCHPCLARRNDLPADVLFVCAGIDILLHEQLEFVNKLKREWEREDGSLEVVVVEKGFHGFVECELSTKGFDSDGY